MSATKLLKKFAVYERTERETLGTVLSLVPKGKLRFIPGTFRRYKEGITKAIGIILENSKGESTTLPCSKAVSKVVTTALEDGTHTKRDLMKFISGLEVLQFDDKEGETLQVISMPPGEGDEEAFATEALAKQKPVTIEDLADAL